MPILTNPKHERFAQEVAQGRSASEAFVIAGYQAHDGNSARLRGNDKVSARIDEILAQGAQRAGVTVERIVKELAKIAFANMGSYLHATSGGDPYFQYASLSEDEKAALSEVTVEDFKEGRGENARDVRRVKFKLHDKLVAFAHNRLEPYDNAALAGKRLFLLYAAAGLDKASLKLTPQLVDFYRKFAPAHPEFETVLISADGSAADMETHLRQTRMPWPALAYDQIAEQPELAALRGAGLPRLVLINGSGELLADSFENGRPVGAQRVLDVLLSRTAVKPAAPATP